MNGVEIVGDDERGQSHAFDLLPLAEAPDLTLETTADGVHVTPIFSFDLSRLWASVVDPLTAAPSIGVALPTAGQPNRPTVDGPDGPDLLVPPISVEQLPVIDRASRRTDDDGF